MKTLQTKLLIGLLPTLAILVALGLWAIVMFYRLGNNIDVILRENYRSVLAAEGMKEAIERMDSGLLFQVIEQMDTSHAFAIEGGRLAGATSSKESASLREASGNRAGQHHPEGGTGDRRGLAALFRQYLASADRFFALPTEPAGRRAEVYVLELFPTFNEIKEHADEVLRLNHDNMTAMDRRARERRPVDPADDRRPDRRRVPGTGCLVPAEPVDSEFDPGGHGWCAVRWLAASSIRSYRPPPAMSWATWPMRSMRWPEHSAIIDRRVRPACSAPEERPGDDRLVSRSRGGCGHGWLGRAGQPGSATPAQRHPGNRAPRSLVSAHSAQDPGE